MTNLAKYNPFNRVDDLFKGFFWAPMTAFEEEAIPIKLDVVESERNYSVKAELPGVKKEDIKVTMNENQVAIEAEVKKEKETKEGEKIVRSERYYGKVYRSFSLDQDIDTTEAQAKYENGILELNLPKKPGKASNQKQLKIQ